MPLRTLNEMKMATDYEVASLDPNFEYKETLVKLWNWVQTKPVCKFRNFQFSEGILKPNLESPNEVTPPVLIDPPPEMAEVVANIMNLPNRFPRVRPEFVRLFLTNDSVSPHTDVPYRYASVNLAISDVLGFTHSKICFGENFENSETDPGFTYEYQKVYLLNTTRFHYVKTKFISSPLRLVASASFIE